MTDDVDAGMALAVAPHIQKVMESVQALLPEGTQFAVLIEVKGNETAGGSIIAATTDREHMAKLAGVWALTTLKPDKT